MKTKALYSLASAVLFTAAFVSCTDEMQKVAYQEQQVLKQIVMTTQDFQTEADGRTIYQIADGAVKCTWADNDTVGVFPNEGAQAYFPMASGAGTNNATFYGGGWALKDGSTYAAYYPFIADILLDRNAVPVNYMGQKQVGDGSTAHLGTYDYMVATPTTPEFGSAQFTFKHLSALVQLKITISQPATLHSVKLVTSNDLFFVEGEVDLMESTPSIAPITPDNEVELALQDISTTQVNQEVTFYMMIPPTNLKTQPLKAIVQTDKGEEEVVLESKNFQSGTVYLLSGEMGSTEAGYKDGVATISEAGTMKQFLGDDCLDITSLKIVGPINGDDVLCLRQMLGGSEFSETEKGKLATLDLSEASIVEGGGWYYENSNISGFYYTSNNIIGDLMFFDCANLKEIVLPAGVTSISGEAFSRCSSLTSITMGDGITSIGDMAFGFCSSLVSIDLPSSITSINNSAFRYCSSLTSIVIPAGVTSIGYYAFSNCSSLTSIDIPTGVTSIGDWAFTNCFSLASINIPDNVTTIGEYAFQGCSLLTSINLPASVISIGNYAFSKCSSLASIDIPDKITTIGECVFYKCSSLTSIDLPIGIISIGTEAFRYCSFLASITIPANVASIDIKAFRDCSSLTQVYCQATTPPTINTSSTNSSFNGSSDSRTLYVPAGCIETYQNSDWASFFGTIQEME